MNCIHTSQSSFSECFFPVFICGYFLSHQSSQCTPKYHFAVSMRTVLANRFMNRNVELYEMNSQIKMKFPRKLLSRLYLRVLFFLYILQSDQQYQFSDCPKTELVNGSTKYSVSWIHTLQTSLSESFFLLFIWVYFPCHWKLHCA